MLILTITESHLSGLGFLNPALTLSAYAPDLSAAAVVRDALIDPDYLIWPSGATESQKAAALAQLAAKGIASRANA